MAADKLDRTASKYGWSVDVGFGMGLGGRLCQVSTTTTTTTQKKEKQQQQQQQQTTTTTAAAAATTITGVHDGGK